MAWNSRKAKQRAFAKAQLKHFYGQWAEIMQKSGESPSYTTKTIIELEKLTGKMLEQAYKEAAAIERERDEFRGRNEGLKKVVLFYKNKYNESKSSKG